jgi:hypothetical protein
MAVVVYWFFGFFTLVTQVEAVSFEIPYYKCLRLNGEANTPGLCSSFDTEYITVDVPEPLTTTTYHDICISIEGQELYHAMADSILDWSMSGCEYYIRYFMSSESASMNYESAETAKKEQKLKDLRILLELDKIQEVYSYGSIMEGSIWRLGASDSDSTRQTLASKRNCFLSTLSAALPLQQAHIGEVGFNSGHSSALMMIEFPTSKITSFDLCSW